MAERIKFYMDEHVPRAVTEGLRRRGVDVLTTQEADDEQHVALALREGRVIVTQDADFLRLHAAGRPHSGIAYAPQHTPIGTIVRSLMLIYDVLSPQDMTGHVEFIRAISATPSPHTNRQGDSPADHRRSAMAGKLCGQAARLMVSGAMSM